jgi:hypothetical protein
MRFGRWGKRRAATLKVTFSRFIQVPRCNFSQLHLHSIIYSQKLPFSSSYSSRPFRYQFWHQTDIVRSNNLKHWSVGDKFWAATIGKPSNFERSEQPLSSLSFIPSVSFYWSLLSVCFTKYRLDQTLNMAPVLQVRDYPLSHREQISVRSAGQNLCPQWQAIKPRMLVLWHRNITCHPIKHTVPTRHLSRFTMIRAILNQMARRTRHHRTSIITRLQGWCTLILLLVGLVSWRRSLFSLKLEAHRISALRTPSPN